MSMFQHRGNYCGRHPSASQLEAPVGEISCAFRRQFGEPVFKAQFSLPALNELFISISAPRCWIGPLHSPYLFGVL